MFPYSSTEISDELVVRLIEARDTTTLAFYDVSDCQLYGCKKKRVLTGALADRADEAGCIPTVYQAIHWFCLVCIPVWPIGTFLVMQEKMCDDPDRDADQFRCIRVETDLAQTFTHYCFLAALATTVFLVWRFLT